MTGPIPPNPESSSDESDDLKLVVFLKNNRPPVPEPHPEAEARLMQAIAETQKQHRPFALKRGWMIVAIAFTSALIGSVLWQLRPDRSGVFAQRELELEAFLVETWQGVSESEDSMAELDWLAPQDPLSQVPSTAESLAYQSRVQEPHP